MNPSRARTVEGPVRSVNGLCWIDGAGVLSCFQRGEVLRLAEHAVGLTQEAVLTEAGTVLAIDRPAGAPSVRAVQGLPAMAAIGGSCGLSREHQVWCWGFEQQTDGPAFRLEPQPVDVSR